MLITHGEPPANVAAQIACCAGAGGMDYGRAGSNGDNDDDEVGGRNRSLQPASNTTTTTTTATAMTSIDVREHFHPYEAPVAVLVPAVDQTARPSSAAMVVDAVVGDGREGGGVDVSGDSSSRNSSAGGVKTNKNNGKNNSNTNGSSTGSRADDSHTINSAVKSSSSSAIIISPLVSYMDHRAPQIETTFVQLQVQ